MREKLSERAALGSRYFNRSSKVARQRLGETAGMNVKHLVCVVLLVAFTLMIPAASAQTVVTHVDNYGFTSVQPVSPVTVEPATVLPPETGGPIVGISSRDGITYSAPDVLITRNGVTRRLTRQITLANGTCVFPNGTVVLNGGSRITIRPEQVLSFTGAFDNAPIAEAVVDVTEETILQRRASDNIRARPASSRLLYK